MVLNPDLCDSLSHRHPDLQDLPCTNAGGPGLINGSHHRIVLDLNLHQLRCCGHCTVLSKPEFALFAFITRYDRQVQFLPLYGSDFRVTSGRLPPLPVLCGLYGGSFLWCKALHTNVVIKLSLSGLSSHPVFLPYHHEISTNRGFS